MASRPPEERPDDADARTRWMVINLTRLVGVAMVVVGLLDIGDVIDLPDLFSYALMAAGLFDVFAVPQFLARKWRTPDA
jgi:hypothetical protein